jgi:hypothetical protein
MSSDILLEEIRENAKGFVGSFLTKQLESSSEKTTEKINSIILAEHVKLNSLKRQHELVNKLKAEMTGRIADAQRRLEDLVAGKKAIEKTIKGQIAKVDELEKNKNNLKIKFDDILARLHAKKSDEALSAIQREYVWELITRIVEIRKGLSPYFGGVSGGSANAEKEKRDIDYLSMRLDQNETLIKSAERQLADILRNRDSG